MAGVIRDTSKGRLWSSIVEAVSLPSCVLRVHYALRSVFAELLAVVASGACSTHVRRRVSRHQAAIGAAAGMGRSRRVRFARKCSSKGITSHVVSRFAVVKQFRALSLDFWVSVCPRGSRPLMGAFQRYSWSFFLAHEKFTVPGLFLLLHAPQTTLHALHVVVDVWKAFLFILITLVHRGLCPDLLR